MTARRWLRGRLLAGSFGGVAAALLVACLATIDESRLERQPGTVPDAEGGFVDDAPSQEGGCVGCDPCGDGGCPPVTVAVGLSTPTLLAVGADDVYVVDSDPADESRSRIKRVPRAAVSSSLAGEAGLVTSVSPKVTALVVTREPALYFANGAAGGSIFRCSLPACTPTLFAESRSPILALAAGPSLLYWSIDSLSRWGVTSCALGAKCDFPDQTLTSPTPVNGLTLFTRGVLVSELQNGIRTMALDGGGATTVYKYPQVFPGPAGAALAVDGFAYWVEDETPGPPTGPPRVVGCALEGCAAPVALAENRKPRQLATDDVALYWLEEGAAGGVMRCPRTGCSALTGGPTRFVADPSNPHSLEIRDSELFWTSRGAGELRRRRLR
ncbi:MAG: hypothetical protein JST00_35665 [Deltaproteobacteria bacterium]|nr:hypothetical protein [Deltaproteobacteria bacterium]